MEFQLLITDYFIRISDELEQVLDGLPSKDLNKQPAPGANSIGWLAWHLTRSHDRNLSEIYRKQQLWITDKWYEKFGRTPDPSETGLGHNSEEMVAFESPDGKTILKYHHAVLERAKMYIENNLSATELKRRVKSPTMKNTNTVRGRLLGIVSEGFQHVGQAAYVRGLLRSEADEKDTS